jgi:dTDP-4-amino-4,6-dideoxygalactose transaminase
MTADYGGMFVTEDEEIYKKAKLWIEDGIVRTSIGRFDYNVVEYAGGYEGSDMQAVVGRVQLKKLPEFNRKRNELVKRYNEAFDTDWTGNHIFPLYLKDYDEVKKAIVELEKQGIGCKSHYPGSRVMTLPLFPLLTFEDQDEIIRKINEIVYRKK